MKTRLVFLATCFTISALTQGGAKRLPPPEVNPVVHGGVRYVAPNDDGQRAVVEAYDVKTERLLWTKTVFTVAIEPKLERDVQWTFIKSMSVKDHALLVIDERNRSHRVDLKAPDDKTPATKLSRTKATRAAREIAIACHLFATDNQGKLPATLNDLAEYLKKGTDLSHFELVTKAVEIAKVENPIKTVLVRSKASWKGKHVAAFVDGHVELVRVEQDGADER